MIIRFKKKDLEKKLLQSKIWIAEIYGLDEIYNYKRFFLRKKEKTKEEFVFELYKGIFDINEYKKRGYYYCDGKNLTLVDEDFIKEKIKSIDPKRIEELESIKKEREKERKRKAEINAEKRRKRFKKLREKEKARKAFQRICEKFKRYAFMNNDNLAEKL